MVSKKYEEHNGKPFIGLTEEITLIARDGKEHKVIARIDTGATKSSIDSKLAAELNLGPIVATKAVKSASGTSLRPVINAKIIIAGKTLETQFTVADRRHMTYKGLIGQNTMKENFYIDPTKKADKK